MPLSKGSKAKVIKDSRIDTGRSMPVTFLRHLGEVGTVVQDTNELVVLKFDDGDCIAYWPYEVEQTGE